jgi:GDP-D-mannose dehydratase
MWKASTMGDEKNGEVTPYNRTEAYAEAGHYGATVVSPGFKSSYGTFTCNGI